MFLRSCVFQLVPYLFCVDGLKGFKEAINAAYPKAQIQRCIIHQIRYSTRYVGFKDIKKLMADLKLVYQAVTEEEALNNLVSFKEKWGKAYPSCVKSWEDNWDILSTFFCDIHATVPVAAKSGK